MAVTQFIVTSGSAVE